MPSIIVSIIVIILCGIAGAVYAIYSIRKDRRFEREHQAASMALLPGPRIREMTAVRPNPMRSPLQRPRQAAGSQPLPASLDSDDFKHISTNYGTYMPTNVDTAIRTRADTEPHHSTSVCVEAPLHGSTHDTFSGGHDTCSTIDSSYGGGFDGGGHHEH